MTSHPVRLWAPACTFALAIVCVPSCGGRVDGTRASRETVVGANASSGSTATPSSSGGGAAASAPPSSGAGASSSSEGSPIFADASPPPTVVDEADASSAVHPSGGACWDTKLPPEVQPILPTASASASCSAASTIAQWNTPIANAGAMNDADARAAIVGRWVACTAGGGSFSSTPHAGVEFGANGRWRLLVTDSSGALVPTTSTSSDAQGRYYALATGQLDIRDDGFTSSQTSFIALSPDRNVLQFKPNAPSTPDGPYYARTSPSPDNGNGNGPSTTDGTCSMVGTWDLAMTNSSPAATFSFDAVGNFVGGPPGSDLCVKYSMYGTYRLSPGMFQITENIGMGACDWWFDAGYPAAFDATCTHLSLTQEFDNCTGGRGYFNGQTTLTKRP